MSETELPNKDLTPTERQQILRAILVHFDDGKLTYSFDVRRNTVGRLWKCTNNSMENGSNFADVSFWTTNCGQKREIDMNYVARVPLNERGTIRSTPIACPSLNSPYTEISNEVKSEDSEIPCNLLWK